MECRICKDSETVRAKLIAPCICSGSIGLVHRRCLEDWQHYQSSHGTEDTSVCSTCNTAYAKNTTLRSFTLWCVGKTVLLVFTPLMLITAVSVFYGLCAVTIVPLVWVSSLHLLPAVEVPLQLLIIFTCFGGAGMWLDALTRWEPTPMKIALQSAVAPWVIQELGDTGSTPGPEV